MLVHDLANELLDCWAEGDRERWREVRDRQQRQYPREPINGEGPPPPSVAEQAEQLAWWQVQLYRNHKRIFGWRRAWQKR